MIVMERKVKTSFAMTRKAKMKGFLVYLLIQIGTLFLAIRDYSIDIMTPVHIVWYISTPLILGFATAMYCTPVEYQVEKLIELNQ